MTLILRIVPKIDREFQILGLTFSEFGRIVVKISDGKFDGIFGTFPDFGKFSWFLDPDPKPYLKWAIFAIASLVKWITSIAEASSFTESDKKSINNGITFAATSEKEKFEN